MLSQKRKSNSYIKYEDGRLMLLKKVMRVINFNGNDNQEELAYTVDDSRGEPRRPCK